LIDKIGKDMNGWRRRTLDGLARIPVELSRVERVLGRSAKDWLAPDVAKVIAMGKAISDGMATLDETFPPLPSDTAAPAAAPTADRSTAAAAAGGDATEPPRAEKTGAE
jgi:hypothetical protein